MNFPFKILTHHFMLWMLTLKHESFVLKKKDCHLIHVIKMYPVYKNNFIKFVFIKFVTYTFHDWGLFIFLTADVILKFLAWYDVSQWSVSLPHTAVCAIVLVKLGWEVLEKFLALVTWVQESFGRSCLIR